MPLAKELFEKEPGGEIPGADPTKSYKSSSSSSSSSNDAEIGEFDVAVPVDDEDTTTVETRFAERPTDAMNRSSLPYGETGEVIKDAVDKTRSCGDLDLEEGEMVFALAAAVALGAEIDTEGFES